MQNRAGERRFGHGRRETEAAAEPLVDREAFEEALLGDYLEVRKTPNRPGSRATFIPFRAAFPPKMHGPTCTCLGQT